MADNLLDALAAWVDLNNTLRVCTESDAELLLKAERKGKARKQFILRIHSRLNRMRAARERKDLRHG